MGSEGNDRELVVSQVSIGGFGNEVTAKMLLDYLENTHGQIYRCRLKKSSTPPETYPEFNADLDQIKIVTDYRKG
ncbi:putative RNA-directed RNA polymerase [Helianthus debilis subsp. tardiflorus]